MNNNEKLKASKFLSLILRHHPEQINLTLDNNGWADTNELIAAMTANTRYKLTFEQLKDIVDTDNKKRYTFNEDFTKIRASQGHSINISLELAPATPPDILYHGTAERHVESIMGNGLNKMGRQYVHLSKDTETAIKVGARHGKPIILVIDTKNMTNDGYLFYISKNEVWLTDNVPAKYIRIQGKR